MTFADLFVEGDSLSRAQFTGTQLTFASSAAQCLGASLTLLESADARLDEITFSTDSSTGVLGDGRTLNCRSSCENLGQGSKQTPVWVGVCGDASLDWLNERSSALFRANCSSSLPLWILLTIAIPLVCLVLMLGAMVVFEWIRAWRMQYRLLLRALPGRIAQRLQKGEEVFDRHEKAVIVFADIVGYTAFSKSLACHDLV